MDTDRPSKDKSPKDRSRQGSEHEDDRSDISFRHNEDTKGNLLEERNSNTSIPHEEDKYQSIEEQNFSLQGKRVHSDNKIQPYPKPSPRSKKRKDRADRPPKKERRAKTKKAAKFVDIEEMLDESDGNESDLYQNMTRQRHLDSNIAEDEKSLQFNLTDPGKSKFSEQQNVPLSFVVPPPPPPREPSGPQPPPEPPRREKASKRQLNSNIKTKKMTEKPQRNRKRIFEQNTYQTDDFDRQDDYNTNQSYLNNYQRGNDIPNMGMGMNNMGNMGNMGNMANIGNMGMNIQNQQNNEPNFYIKPPVLDLKNNIGIDFNPFEKLLGRNLESGRRTARLKKQVPESGATNLFENLKYGCAVTLNVEEGKIERKLGTKLRISDKVNATEMQKDEYNINCIFRLLPASQHIMQDKILDIIEDDTIPLNIEIEYENFVSEIESNTAAFNLGNQQSIKFEDTFQLYQDSSKRFLCFFPCKVNDIKRMFKNQYSDSECFYLGFSNYPADNTHFSFETVAMYQQEEDGYVKKYHYVYLTCYEKGKTHYLYNIGKNCVLTESYKTPITFNVIRDPSTEVYRRTVGRTDVSLLAFANDSFYLNVPQVIDTTTGRYGQKNLQFQRWQDSKSIDFNGWWQIEVLENPSKITLRNFNSGKYIKYVPPLSLQSCPLEMVDDANAATQFMLMSINSNERDVNNFEETDIFKIKV